MKLLLGAGLKGWAAVWLVSPGPLPLMGWMGGPAPSGVAAKVLTTGIQGTVSQDFCICFFAHQLGPPGPIRDALGPF